MKRLNTFEYWPLESVLSEKYKCSALQAKDFADFLLPMLNWNPEQRPAAHEMLKNKWLKIKYDPKDKFNIHANSDTGENSESESESSPDN